jgi:23S rRNA (guanine745-N1)-methyltransferase
LIGGLGLLSDDPSTDERLERELGARLEIVSREEREWPMSLGASDLEALVMMGPSAFHAKQPELDTRIEALPERVQATASVTLTLCRRR